MAYQYRDATGRIDQYAVTYLRKDSYLQSTTSGQNVSNTPNVQPSTDESVYDTRGNLVALAQHTQYAGGAVADTVRVFAYDGHGEIIERRDGTADGATLDQGSSAVHENQHYVYVNGQQVAHYDEGGTLDVLDEVTAFSNSTSGPGGYVVQAGDTLQSIAQAEYGDASLWYVIAQANALGSDDDLAIGQALTIPQVTTNGNTATTFKPYDPSRIVGSTTPNLPTIAPPPPPPSSQHCNALAEIVVIAVAVVVSVVSFGTLAPVAGALAAGAIAGAAASAASQLVGDALGVSHGFSFDQVLVGAATGAIGGGLGEAFSEGGALASTFASTSGNGISIAGNALIGAASYAGAYETEKLTGQAAHFSWAGLVASAAGSSVGGALGSTRGDMAAGRQGSNEWNNLEAGAAQGVVTREASTALGDNHVQSWASIGEGVAGQVLGNAASTGSSSVLGQIRPEVDAVDGLGDDGTDDGDFGGGGGGGGGWSDWSDAGNGDGSDNGWSDWSDAGNSDSSDNGWSDVGNVTDLPPVDVGAPPPQITIDSNPGITSTAPGSDTIVTTLDGGASSSAYSDAGSDPAWLSSLYQNYGNNEQGGAGGSGGSGGGASATGTTAFPSSAGAGTTTTTSTSTPTNTLTTPLSSGDLGLSGAWDDTLYGTGDSADTLFGAGSLGNDIASLNTLTGNDVPWQGTPYEMPSVTTLSTVAVKGDLSAADMLAAPVDNGETDGGSQEKVYTGALMTPSNFQLPLSDGSTFQFPSSLFSGVRALSSEDSEAENYFLAAGMPGSGIPVNNSLVDASYQSVDSKIPDFMANLAANPNYTFEQKWEISSALPGYVMGELSRNFNMNFVPSNPGQDDTDDMDQVNELIASANAAQRANGIFNPNNSTLVVNTSADAGAALYSMLGGSSSSAISLNAFPGPGSSNNGTGTQIEGPNAGDMQLVGKIMITQPGVSALAAGYGAMILNQNGGYSTESLDQAQTASGANSHYDAPGINENTSGQIEAVPGLLDAATFATELSKQYDSFQTLGEIDVYDSQGQKYYTVTAYQYQADPYEDGGVFRQVPVSRDYSHNSVSYPLFEQSFEQAYNHASR